MKATCKKCVLNVASIYFSPTVIVSTWFWNFALFQTDSTRQIVTCVQACTLNINIFVYADVCVCAHSNLRGHVQEKMALEIAFSHLAVTY